MEIDLKTILQNSERLEANITNIAGNLEIYYKNLDFYKLPFDVLTKIIERSNASSNIYVFIMRKCSHAYPDKAALLLNVMPINQMSLKESLEIVGSLTTSPFCMNLPDLYREEERSPQADELYVLQEIEKKIDSLSSHVVAIEDHVKSEHFVEEIEETLTRHQYTRCTYSDNGKHMISGQFYQCQTCQNLPYDHAICPSCAHICHRGHVLTERFGQYYCDCGAHELTCECKIVPYD